MKNIIVKHLCKVILALTVAAVSATLLATAATAATAAEVNFIHRPARGFLAPHAERIQKKQAEHRLMCCLLKKVCWNA